MIEITAVSAAPPAPKRACARAGRARSRALAAPSSARPLALGAILLLALAAGCARRPPVAVPTPVVARLPGLPPGVGTPANPIGTGFTSRGVIEGFYGPPWSYQDRLDMLRFMGRVGMNTYIYAPKDDPYHRRLWREPYPPQQLAQLANLVKVGRESGVNVWFAISPGLSMTYSSKADYKALLAKLDAVRAIGVRDVGLFLDDVPETLIHPADRARFSSLAAAHAYLIKRLRKDLAKRGMGLIVAQTTYTDVFGSKAYLRELGEMLPRSIPLIWTGVDVRSFDMTVPQALAWAAMIRRKPLVWDNYPVDDFARWRLFLGPLTGRSPDLETAVDGYVSNPMSEAHASMLPLWTIADYLRDPAHYDPDRAEAEALTALYGNSPDPVKAREGVAAMRVFADVYPTGMWDGPVDPLWVPARAFDYGRADTAVVKMQAALDTMRVLAESDSATWWPLLQELTPFADSATARLEAARADTMYTMRDDSLFFRTEPVTVQAVWTPPVIDGNLSDWSGADWRPMYGPAGFSARVALRADSSTLYVAVQVPDSAVTAFGGDSVTRGDHVGIMVAGDPAGRQTRLGPGDMALFATPASATGPAALSVWSFAPTPFYREVLAMRPAPLSSFVTTNFSRPLPPAFLAEQTGARVASARDAQGWSMEIALPRAPLPVLRTSAGDELQMSLVAVDASPGGPRVGSLGPRGYPANPTTYTEVILPR